MMKLLVSRLCDIHAFTIECWQYLWQERMLTFFFLVCSLAAALTEGISISLLAPLLSAKDGANALSGVPVLGLIADIARDRPREEALQVIAIGLMAALVARGFLQYGVQALSVMIQVRFRESTTLKCFNALTTLTVGYVNAHAAGDMQNSVTLLPQRLSNLLKSFADILWNALLALTYLVLMLSISVELSLVAFLFVLGLSVVLRLFTAGPLYRAGRQNSEFQSELNQYVYEYFNNFSLIKLSNAEEFARAKFRKVFLSLMAAMRRLYLVQAVASPAFSTTAGVFICVLLFYAATFNPGPAEEWIGTLLLFLFVLFRILSPVNAINVARARIRGEFNAFERLDAFLKDAEQHRIPEGRETVSGITSGIVLEGVSFSYEADQGPALKDISFTIQKGERVAVVGPSGAGKTTLVALLVRFFDPDRGRILIDGKDLRDLRTDSWRGNVSVVSQDALLFNDTVTNNIAYGKSDVDMDRVRQAAEIACADEFISNLPEGYDTALGDKGVRLSGGQKQRIALARAVLSDPPFLILDEATSQLDSITEAALKDAIDKFSKDRTILIIAHRLSTVQNADKILVMKEGHLVEQGTPEELNTRGTFYHRLLSLQELRSDSSGDVN